VLHDPTPNRPLGQVLLADGQYSNSEVLEALQDLDPALSHKLARNCLTHQLLRDALCSRMQQVRGAAACPHPLGPSRLPVFVVLAGGVVSQQVLRLTSPATGVLEHCVPFKEWPVSVIAAAHLSRLQLFPCTFLQGPPPSPHHPLHLLVSIMRPLLPSPKPLPPAPSPLHIRSRPSHQACHVLTTSRGWGEATAAMALLEYLLGLLAGEVK
jgi:hypothetical protein